MQTNVLPSPLNCVRPQKQCQELTFSLKMGWFQSNFVSFEAINSKLKSNLREKHVFYKEKVIPVVTRYNSIHYAGRIFVQYKPSNKWFQISKSQVFSISLGKFTWRICFLWNCSLPQTNQPNGADVELRWGSWKFQLGIENKTKWSDFSFVSMILW